MPHKTGNSKRDTLHENCRLVAVACVERSELPNQPSNIGYVQYHAHDLEATLTCQRHCSVSSSKHEK
jgi:hypothetical protein